MIGGEANRYHAVHKQSGGRDYKLIWDYDLSRSKRALSILYLYVFTTRVQPHYLFPTLFTVRGTRSNL